MLGGYGRTRLPSTDSVHFVRNDEIDDSIYEIASYLKLNGIGYVYVDYPSSSRGEGIVNVIANCLTLDHRPYGARPWVRFLDDLIALSHRAKGLVIVIGNADVFFDQAREDAFCLIEAFLIQLHHWLEMNKPCHLCFQMETNETVEEAFSGYAK